MSTEHRLVRRSICCWVLAGLLGVASGSRADEVDDYVRSEMLEQHVPGLSLAVVRNGRIVKANGYGLASLELNALATAETVYPIASVTKQFTAAAILLLVQDGKLGLDDRISRYLEKTPAAWREVTVRQLLANTSGIKDHLNEMHGRTCNGTSPEEIAAHIGELPLNFAPGSQWLYSNTNYLLLGMILQKVSGKPFDEFLAERVFRPLGMQATRRNSRGDVIPNRAAGYVRDGARLRNSPFLEPTLYDNADAGLLSSVLDLARWDAALYGDSLLKGPSREQMWTPVRLASGASYPYGLGWHLDDVNGHRLVYHDGNRADGSSILARYLDDKLTVIVLANRSDVNTGRIARHVAGLVIPALMPADRPIEDTEPRVTALVKTVLLAIQDGTVGPEPFTAEMWKGFYPAGVKGFQSVLQSSGAFKSIALLARKAEGETRTYRYRVVFGQTSLVLDFTLTKENKISGMVGSQQ